MPRSTIPDTSSPSIPASSSPSTSEPATNYRQSVYNLIKGKTASPLSAIIVQPNVFKFADQIDQEEIIMVVRQHWFINLKWITLAILMCFAPLILKFLPIFDFVPLRFYFPSLLFWYLLTFALAFEGFLNWWFNVFIVTEERVVDIDFYNLLNTKVSDAELDKIQDVSYEVAGMAGTFLNFADITIQTAAEKLEIEVPNVPNPELVAKVLQNLRLEEKQEELEGRIK